MDVIMNCIHQKKRTLLFFVAEIFSHDGDASTRAAKHDRQAVRACMC